MTTLPQELKAALAQTDAWLDRAHDLWTENQSKGTPMHRGFAPSDDGTSREHRALGMPEFQALWEGLGYGGDRPLPPEVARHRSPSGSSVIDELLMVRLRSAHAKEWGEALSWALGIGWNPWTPGYEGSSAVMRLLEQTSQESTWDLFNRLDRSGVKWGTPIQDPEHPDDEQDALVLGPTRIIQGDPGETLLMQSVSHCYWEGEDFIAPVIEHWIDTLPHSAFITPRGRSLDSLTVVPVGQLRVAGWVNRRLGRDRAQEREARTPTPDLASAAVSQRKRRYRS